MNISKNFTLSEMTATSTGIENSPNAQQINSLVNLVEKDIATREICTEADNRYIGDSEMKKVNKAVGGAKTSQHMRGEAADIKGVLTMQQFLSW